MKSKLLTLVVLVAVAAAASCSWAATTASQSFTVTVPTNLSITAPAAASLTHDMTNSNQAFPAQAWVVTGNTKNGVNVTLVAGSPFTNTADSAAVRDVQLGLSMGNSVGSGAWTVTTASDSTNYANASPKLTATVAASSNGVGSGTLNLTVTFVTNNIATVEAGSYTTTVTGTVASN